MHWEISGNMTVGELVRTFNGELNLFIIDDEGQMLNYKAFNKNNLTYIPFDESEVRSWTMMESMLNIYGVVAIIVSI